MNAVIKVSRETPARSDNCSYVTDVFPQNDDFARDNLLRRDEWVSREEAMVFPVDVAKLLVARWTQSPNRATPEFFIELV